jgi:hypothetical protein
MTRRRSHGQELLLCMKTSTLCIKTARRQTIAKGDNYGLKQRTLRKSNDGFQFKRAGVKTLNPIPISYFVNSTGHLEPLRTLRAIPVCLLIRYR